MRYLYLPNKCFIITLPQYFDTFPEIKQEKVKPFQDRHIIYSITPKGGSIRIRKPHL